MKSTDSSVSSVPNLSKNITRIPTIDVFVDKTLSDLRSAEKRHLIVSDTYRQARISGADHSFLGYEDQIVQAVIGWLKEREGNVPLTVSSSRPA